MGSSVRLCSKAWLYKVPKKKPKKRKPKGKKSRIREYADRLEANLPASEIWFRGMYKKNKWDLFNEPFGKYIPDVINQVYRYIIEIDGAIHDTPEQQHIDRVKDNYYLSRNYKVFRIKAYNMDSYTKVIDELTKLIASYSIGYNGTRCQ